ncbi:hypothetical protein HNQ91_003630 [Filimonas zeae]|uniref:Uncharacterized protein n=1 Tax=Filimonas zeae TaxID=1737353 RepID=A0A917MX30_9BACT|nr:hypothetical protein [Filimonas zeae]MDR6340565.1 hypothetical protein [Filimonas zeae]GGH73329.1 hypothetical protein GCM10011379_34720 [Filimonas zeae]
MTQNLNDKKEQQKDNKDAAVQPDPETLHTTDPQEHMEGPVSSLVKKAAEEMDDDEVPEEEKEKPKK